MGEGRGPFGAAQPCLDGAAQLRRDVAEAPLDGLEIALDDGQQIVEIMSNAARQRPQAL